MASTYTGNAGGVSLASVVTETLPSDGDPLASSSVNTPLSKIADYLESLRQRTTGAARAWGVFSTNGSGGTTLIASYNVSTVVVVGTQAVVSFSAALPSANYLVVGNNGFGTGSAVFPRLGSTVLSSSQTTTQFALNAVDTTTGSAAAAGFNNTIYSYVVFAVFG